MSHAYARLAAEHPSATKEEILDMLRPVYEEPGRTKQAFKDDCDINKILYKFEQTGTVSHLQRFEGHYGEFATYDLLEAERRLARGRAIFNDLPAELRREFHESPAEFFKFVNAPENVGRLHEVFPELAQKGRQLPDVSMNTPPRPVEEAAVEPPGGGE